MKLKKIYVNILEKKDDVQILEEKITDEDIKNDFMGFHIVLENKTEQNFQVVFLMKGGDLQYSLDMKKTEKDCLTVEYNLQCCKLDIKGLEKRDIIIWTKEEIFRMDKIKINIGESETGELDSIYLNSTFDKQFVEIFGFTKKYHFDQYRMLLVISLCNSGENQEMISQIVNLIVKHAKMERLVDERSQQFFELVFNHLLEENVGALDMFSNYRGKIINKLRLKVDNLGKIINTGETVIDVKRNVFGNAGISMIKQIELGKVKVEEPKEFQIDKKIDNNPFERNKIEKVVKYQSVDNEVFLLVEIGRKGHYQLAQNSVVLLKYGGNSVTEIEKTVEKIIVGTEGESYEIILYLELAMIARFEALLENLFFNYDNLKKVKIVSYKTKMGRFHQQFSEIQKLIVLSNFINCVNPYFFLVSVNSWFPPRYMHFIQSNYKEKIVMMKKSYVMYENGKIDMYEGTANNIFGYFVECIFPVLPKHVLKKLSFKSQYLGAFNKFRDFKNFLVKNGTIKDVDMVDYFHKHSLHKFEGS